MNRKSGIELLRILCMFGIVYMHTFGSMLETVRGGNMALAVLEMHCLTVEFPALC